MTLLNLYASNSGPLQIVYTMHAWCSAAETKFEDFASYVTPNSGIHKVKSF